MFGQHGLEEIGTEPARRSSRDVTEDVFVRQVAPGLGQGQDLAPQFGELGQRELAPQGVSHQVAPTSAGTACQPSEAPFELAVEADGEITRPERAGSAPARP
jgi:hypothetical protein